LVQGESLLSSRRTNKKDQAGGSLLAFLCHFPTQDHRPEGGNPPVKIKAKACFQAAEATKKPKQAGACWLFFVTSPTQDHRPEGGNP